MALTCGCETATVGAGRPDTVIVVPGLGGDGPAYTWLVSSLRDAGDPDCLQVFDWGVPLLLLKDLDDGIERDAERKLAATISRWHDDHSRGRVTLLSHSGGAGVALGALRLLREGESVRTLVMLAPGVSPGYDLRPALKHVAGSVHVFYSDRDTFWMDWAPRRYGGYDHVKGALAGLHGFDLNGLPPGDRRRVIQHPYDPGWNADGNDGGHAGPLARRWVVKYVEPLLRGK